MRPTWQEIVAAVGELGQINYFPVDELARVGVMKLLDRLVNSREELEWLTAKLIDSYDKWPGPLAVRGVFCTRFIPRDGQEAALGCNDPVYREIEARIEIPNQKLITETASNRSVLKLIEAANRMEDQA